MKFLKNEKALVRRVMQSDEDAFQQLYCYYQPFLYRHIYYRFGDPTLSEDILQETFLRIWKNRKTLKPERSFYGYICKISNNIIKDHYKKKKVRQKYEISMQSTNGTSSDSPESTIDAQNLQKKIHSAVNLYLPEKCRMIFLLSRMEGKSNREIAALLGITKKTVENQLYNGLKILRKKLSEYL